MLAIVRPQRGSQLNSKQHNDRITQAFESGRGLWRSCTWYSPIGPDGADVHELSPRHAILLAEATSGQESQTWEAVGKWLAKVEQDALAAEMLAATAVQQAQLHNYAAALDNINLAVALEAQYREPQVWCTLQYCVLELTLKYSVC